MYEEWGRNRGLKGERAEMGEMLRDKRECDFPAGIDKLATSLGRPQSCDRGYRSVHGADETRGSDSCLRKENTRSKTHPPPLVWMTTRRAKSPTFLAPLKESRWQDSGGQVRYL